MKITPLGRFCFLPAISFTLSFPIFSVSPQGFDEVQKTVGQRLGQHVESNVFGGQRQRRSEDHRRIAAEQLSVDDAVQIALLKNDSLQAMSESFGIA